METRHVVILLDIHNTFIAPHDPRTTEKILWNGQDIEIWERHLATLKQSGREKGIQVHYGIAHSKSEYRHKPKKDTPSSRNDKTLVDPDLIFATDNFATVCQALYQAKKTVEHKHSTSVDDSDTWVMNGDKNIFQSICESLEIDFIEVDQVDDAIEQDIEVEEVFQKVAEN